MTRPWALQIASDLKRDGLAVELLNESREVVAEVFRCDADKTVKVNVFEADVPDAILRELIEAARERLGTFEDGTPLPETIVSPCDDVPKPTALRPQDTGKRLALDYAPAHDSALSRGQIVLVILMLAGFLAFMVIMLSLFPQGG